MGYTNEEKDSQEYGALKKHILNYGSPNDKQAWGAFAVTVLLQVLAAILVTNDLDVIGWTIHTLNAVRFFIQFHDMAHFSFFRSVLLNKLVGTLIGVYVCFPFQAWRDGHNHHHRHFGNLDRLDLSQTILFTRREYQGWSFPKRTLVRLFREPVVFFLFTSPFVWFIGLLFTVPKRYGIISKPFFEKICSYILFLYVFPIFGINATKAIISIVIAQILGTILFHLQHSVNEPYREHKGQWDSNKAALEGSTFLEIPLAIKIFTAGIQYHHIHHLNTNVASYSIQSCHESLEKAKESEQSGWNRYNINRVGWLLALRSLANVMLDQDKQQLVPFSYTF